MRKQFAVILTAVVIGAIGAHRCPASEDDVPMAEENCQILAVEQNIAREDMEQFMDNCLAEQAEPESYNPEEGGQEPAEEENLQQ